MVGKGLQVLHDGSEVGLVACTGKAAQPHTLEAVVCLQVRKAHLDLLALVTGFGELRCTHPGARRITCVLMHVARELSEGHIRGALGLERTWTAVAGACAIKDSPAIMHRPGCPEKLTNSSCEQSPFDSPNGRLPLAAGAAARDLSGGRRIGRPPL